MNDTKDLEKLSQSELIDRIVKLDDENAKLKKHAIYDSLTGALTQYGFEQNMELRFHDVPAVPERERRRKKERREVVYGSLAVLDLAGFKGVNDAIGRSEGDTLLNFVANTLKSYTRTSDVIARWGGDEFVIFFHKQRRDFTERRLDLIRKEVQKINLGKTEKEIKRLLHRTFLVDFRGVVTELDRKVDLASLIKTQLDSLEHTGSELRLAHLK